MDLIVRLELDSSENSVDEGNINQIRCTIKKDTTRKIDVNSLSVCLLEG